MVEEASATQIAVYQKTVKDKNVDHDTPKQIDQSQESDKIDDLSSDKNGDQEEGSRAFNAEMDESMPPVPQKASHIVAAA